MQNEPIEATVLKALFMSMQWTTTVALAIANAFPKRCHTEKL